jgi:DNA-binding CsgD family transcriptional regulator
MLFEELLESLALSAKERMIVDMMLENYNGAEIGEILGLTRQAINVIKLRIGDKLKEELCTDTTASLRMSSMAIL